MASFTFADIRGVAEKILMEADLVVGITPGCRVLKYRHGTDMTGRPPITGHMYEGAEAGKVLFVELPSSEPDTAVDDGEVWVRHDDGNVRVGMTIDDAGNAVSHSLTSEEALMLASSLLKASGTVPELQRLVQSAVTVWQGIRNVAVESTPCGILNPDGLRTLADVLEESHRVALHNKSTIVGGQVVIPQDNDTGDATIAFRCSDGDGELPRVCLFSDNHQSPEF